MELLHTEKDAQYCLWYIRKYICEDAKIVGSFSKGAKQSMKDIDIYLPNFFPKGIAVWMRAIKLRNKISFLLEAESVEVTDWGGWFFHNTAFGNVDIFFDVNNFDY